MRIAIIGTRGIPNNYGGFEQFAEYLALGMVKRGIDVTVYNPAFHPFKEENFNGVKITRKWSPEKQLGASGNFIYDYLCLKDAISQKFDIIYEAGYGTNSISHPFLNFRGSVIVTNMDGLEWKRAKWGRFTRKLMKYFEKLAVKTSHHLVADNSGIQKYLREQYNVDSHMLAYGAEIPEKVNDSLIAGYGLEPQKYFLLIARLEPENNIEAVIDGHIQSNTAYPLICIGGKTTKHYEALVKKTENHKNIKFIGGIYDKDALDSLRQNAIAYFHGHSVGGTNPSLLEAMASRSFIISHDNDFNKGVLGKNALYFKSSAEVAAAINNIGMLRQAHHNTFIAGNLACIENEYAWSHIIDLYISFFKKIYNGHEKQG